MYIERKKFNDFLFQDKNIAIQGVSVLKVHIYIFEFQKKM